MNVYFDTLSAVWSLALVALLVSCGVSVLLVVTKGLHGKLSMDAAHGIQKFHTAPTPRIGGVALAAGGLAAWLVSAGANNPLFDSINSLLGLLLLSGLPAFAAGLVEDLTKKVSVRTRLLATAASGLLAALLTGYWVASVNIWGLDSLLAWVPFALLFTAFAVSGIANSVNIIDGFNGLASGVVVLMLVTMGIIAARAGDETVLGLTFVGIAFVLGFMVLNFPKGHIFLGDAGAYSLGFYVAMLAVALAARNPDTVSPWAMLLVCGYPFIETLFSIYRRITRKRRHNPGSPDASHLHSLVYRRIVSRRLFQGKPAWMKNAMTSPFMWVYSSVPMFGAIFWPASLPMILVWLFISFVVYQQSYKGVLVLSPSLVGNN